MIALSASYGEMVVGDLERGTVGSDAYGDVGFRTSTTCGATMLLWTSGPLARDYTRGTHEFGSVSLPDGLATRLADADSNGVPDTMDSTTIDGIRTPNMSIDERQTILDDMTRSHDPNKTTSLITASRNGDQITL
jgi:hypothetical protein